jgi:hypothetical protein
MPDLSLFLFWLMFMLFGMTVTGGMRFDRPRYLIPLSHWLKSRHVPVQYHETLVECGIIVPVETADGPMMRSNQELRRDQLVKIEGLKRKAQPPAPQPSLNASLFPLADELAAVLGFPVSPRVLEDLAREGEYGFRVDHTDGSTRIDKLLFKPWFKVPANQQRAVRLSQNLAATDAVEKRKADEAAKAKAAERERSLKDANRKANAAWRKTLGRPEQA